MKLDNSFSLIAEIYHSIEKLLLEELQAAGVHDLVPSHGKLLYVLFCHHQLSMKEIAEKIQKTPQTVTALARKLEKLGYIQCCKLDDDRRTTMVTLTAKGWQLENVFISVSKKILDMQYNNISEAEKTAFIKTLEKIRQNFSAVK